MSLVDIGIWLCKGLHNVIVSQAVQDILPPLLNSIVSKNVMLIRFDVKLLQSSNTHRNKTKPLSEAFFGSSTQTQSFQNVLSHNLVNKNEIIVCYYMLAFKIIGFAFRSLFCCKFGHSSEFPTAVTVASGNPACSNWHVALAEVAKAPSNQSNTKQADRVILEFQMQKLEGRGSILVYRSRASMILTAHIEMRGGRLQVAVMNQANQRLRSNDLHAWPPPVVFGGSIVWRMQNWVSHSLCIFLQILIIWLK